MKKISGLLAVGLLLLAGCGGGDSPIGLLIEMVKEDPSAKNFLKKFPLPDGFEVVGNPEFNRVRTVSAKGSETKIKRILFSGKSADQNRTNILAFFKEGLLKKGYDVQDTEKGLTFRGDKWSGVLDVSSVTQLVITIDARPNE
jgi:hypothetical protein